MKKRIISFMLILMMILTSVPIEAFGHQSRIASPNKETEVKYNVVNINGQKYKAYKISDIMPDNMVKKNNQTRTFKSVLMRTPGYVDQTEPDPHKRWTLKINWETRDIDFPKGTIIVPVVYDPDGEYKSGDEIELGIFEVDATHAKKGNTNERIEMKVKEGINPNDYIDGAVIYCPEFIKYDLRIVKNNEWNGHEYQEYQFLANVSQNVMSVYKISWFDNDSSKRQEFEGRWKGSESIETDLVGSTEDGYYTVIDEFIGRDDFYTGNKSDQPYTPVDKTLVGKLKKGYKTKPINLVNLNIDDVTPVDTAGSYIRKDDVETQKGFLQLGTKYYYNITGDYRTLHEIELREALKVKFDPNGATFDPAVKAEQEIGHSMKIGESFGDLEAVVVPTKDQISNIPQKDNKDQELVGWVVDKANKDLDFSNGNNADKLVNPNGYEVKKNVTFYAVYAPKAQGRVAVQYVDAEGNAILDKYKIKDEKYPDHAEGNKGKPVEASKIKEPKFIGYKRTADTIADAIKNKTYETDKIQTVEVKYEKLPDIIPAKNDDGTDNPKATDDVKNTYKSVTIKVDSEKGQFKKGSTVKTEDAFVYYVNPVEGKTLEDVKNESGLTAESKDANVYKIDTAKEWTFTPAKTKADADVATSTEVTKTNFDENNIDMVVNFVQTKADQLKDKLEAQDIRVWVDENDTDGSKITWKEGVKLNAANENNQTLKGLLAGATVTDLGEGGTLAQEGTKRNSSKQNLPDGKKGNLKVAFDDGSSLVVENQMLYVAPLKVPVKPGEDNQIDPEKLPTDKVAVKFLLGEGVKIGTKEGNKTTPVLYETYYVKPNTGLEKSDIPKTELQDNYKNNKWYNGNAELAETDYKTITEEKSFVAKATLKGDGSALVEYHAAGTDITADIADLKIDGQTYPANNKLPGKADTAIDTTKITQPELLGYKIVNIKTEPATDAKYTEAGTAKVIFNYEKIDDIVPGKGNTKPAGYVTIEFKTTEGAKLDGAETIYYVNPKAKTKAKVALAGDDYQISGTKADGNPFTAKIPVVSNDGENYEVKYAEGSNDKWAYNNFDKVGQDLATDTTFTAQVIKLGKPSVTFPPVEIEKGGSKEVTPDPKDKYGKKINNPVKPENPDKIEKPDGVTVTVEDDGKIKIEVPKDYKGPGTFTIKIPYKIDDKEVIGEINVTIKEDKPTPKPEPQPEPKPEPKPVPEPEFNLDFKVHEYVPTFPVYAEVPKKSVEDVKVLDKLWYIFHIDKYDYEEVRNYNSTSHKMDVTPVIRNERTMLPLRYVAEAIGATVKWDHDTRTATFTKDGLTATIQIDSDEIVLSNGKTVKMDSKPLNINARILVSVVNVGNVFGLTNGNTLDGVDQDIEWDHDTRTATIYIRR